METEIWKDIENFEGRYQISNLGRVKSLERTVVRPNNTDKRQKEKLLSICVGTTGYKYVKLYADAKGITLKIHRGVASAFIENPLNKPFINHKDGNKLNNDLTNLEWVTHTENMRHAFDNGLIRIAVGEERKSKVKESQVIQMRREYERGKTIKHLADKYSIGERNVHHIVKRQTWKHL
jgi:hypothetical protein